MNKLTDKILITMSFLAKPFGWLFLNNTHRTRILILAEGRVLVVKNWLGYGEWSLPGGGVKKAEAPLTGVIRELKEEVDLIIEPADIEFLEKFAVDSHGLNVQISLFRSKLDKVVPINHRQKHELVSAKWLKPSELTAASSSPELQLALSKYTT